MSGQKFQQAMRSAEELIPSRLRKKLSRLLKSHNMLRSLAHSEQDIVVPKGEFGSCFSAAC